RTYFLYSHCRVPVAGYHPCDHHGDPCEEHVLHAGGKADAQDREEVFFSRIAEKADMAEYDGVPEREDYKHGGDNELGKNGGYGSAHNTHGRERTCSEDQDRIQHHVDDQASQGGGKGIPAVSRCREDPCKCRSEEHTSELQSRFD